MIKKLKMLSLAVFAAVAAVTTTPAATTITNVIQDITVTFTIYPSNSTAVNSKGTVLTSTVKPAALTTENVLTALEAATGAKFSSAAKLVLLTQYTDTNIYGYAVTYVLVEQTNKHVVEIPSTEVYDSFTNDVYYYLYNLGLTNTDVENVSTNFTTSVVLTNISTTPIYAVDDGGKLTLLTNLTPYPPYSSQNIDDQATLNPNASTTNYYPVFGDYSNFDTNGNAIAGGSPDIGLYNASNDWAFSGTTKAIDGAAIFGTSVGTSYGLESGGSSFYGYYNGGGGVNFALNSPADWVFNAILTGPATIATKNLGSAKDPAPINYIAGTWTATGTGWMGGTKSSFVYTNSPPTTNVWITNGTPFVLKGSVSLGAPTISAAP
jgi:hypothetical protein